MRQNLAGAILDSIIPAINRAEKARKADFHKCCQSYSRSVKKEWSVREINRLVDPILLKHQDPAILMGLLEQAYRYGFYDGEDARQRLRAARATP